MSTFFSGETYGVARKTEYTRDARAWYREHGLCPACGSNRDSEYLYCLACRRHNADYQRNNTPTERTREMRRRVSAEWYQRKKSEGICTKCGKRPAMSGRTWCSICAGKQNGKAKAQRAEAAALRDPSKCYFCGEPVLVGKKVCEKHYAACTAKLAAASRIKKSSHPWKIANELIKEGVNK